MLLRKTFRFEASHVLPKHPGKCSRLHGHSWVLHVFVEGEVDTNTGFVIDYAEISNVVKPLIESLDHHHLGTWNGSIGIKYYHTWAVAEMPVTFYPTSENLLVWIGRRLIENRFQAWTKLAIEETCTSYAELTRGEFDRYAKRI